MVIGVPPIGGIDAFTVLMHHYDGTDGSQTFTDSSASGHVFGDGTSDAQIDTAQSKFGGASLLLDGSARLQKATHADFDFGTGNFTIDFWVRFNASTQQYFFDGTGGNVASMRCTPSTGAMQVHDDSVTVMTGGSTPFSTGVWYHIALVRNGNVWTIYRDGVSYLTDPSYAGSYGVTSGNFFIGCFGNISFTINGWLDEFRISKGIARWTANFTPPAGPYTT